MTVVALFVKQLNMNHPCENIDTYDSDEITYDGESTVDPLKCSS